MVLVGKRDIYFMVVNKVRRYQICPQAVKSSCEQ